MRKIRNRLLFVAPGALALASCGEAEAPDAPAAENIVPDGEPSASPAADALSPADQRDNAAARVLPGGDGTIPTGFQGRWASNQAECDGPADIAKTTLTIDGESIRFYEAVATPADIITRDAEHFRARFDMSGEGENWVMDMDLRLQNGGTAMLRHDRGPDALPGKISYVRCEG